MGIQRIGRPLEEVRHSSSPPTGEWYTIATMTPPGGAEEQASAEFILSDGEATRNNFIRLRASLSWGHDDSSLVLEEYACWRNPAALTGISLARLTTYDSSAYALDVWSEATDASNMRLRVRHEDWYKGARWEPLAAFSAANAGSTTITQRGIGPTGSRITPTMQNSWVHYDPPFSAPSYRMHPGSTVEISGVVKNGTNGSPIFTLPVGYRPAHQMIFPAVCNSNTFARCDVLPNGTVVPSTSSNVYFTMDGIRFTAEL